MSGFGMAVVSTISIGGLDFDDEGVGEMTWDYRVIFTPFEEGSDEGEYTIREVYYDDEGEISWWSDEAVELISEDFWDLAADFDLIAEAFDKPVLVLIGEELVEDDEEYEEGESEGESEDEDEE